MSFNKKAHLRANIDAIKLAFTLEKNASLATAQERALLQTYSGFGGIKAILNREQDVEMWAEYEQDLYPLVQELHGLLRDKTSSEKEYKSYVDSLKNSILTAFYTPNPIIDAIASSIKAQNVAVHRMLEPSAGVGSFIDSFTKHHPQLDVVGIEKDLITGKILAALHPHQQIVKRYKHQQSFQRLFKGAAYHLKGRYRSLW